MQKLIKIVIVSVVLLLPVLVFLFLKQYGSNEFDLPVYYPEGNPFEQCDQQQMPFKLSSKFIEKYEMGLPALIYFSGADKGEFQYDLKNVLDNYAEIQLHGFTTDSLVTTDIRITDDETLALVNCQLVLGEEVYLSEPIFNKYVLIDKERSIRGYFEIEELDDIERLDIELDILLNY